MTRPLTRAYRLALLASAAFSLSISSPKAWSQTPIGGTSGSVPLTPPGKAPSSQPSPFPQQPSSPGHIQTAPLSSAPPSASPSAMARAMDKADHQAVHQAVPLSDAVHTQALQQSEGVYPEMDRMGAGGQIQDAWNISDPTAGVYTVRMCGDCVYKVRTREFMTTTVILPDDALIASADLGDPTGFQVQVKNGHMLAVRPSAYGLDTNLNVYTKSGGVYPFYIRSESFNSIHVPDLVVKVQGREKPQALTGPVGDDKGNGAGDGKPQGLVDSLTNPKAKTGDFVRNVPFDPTKLHGFGDYKLWGGGDGFEDLKPDIVYRDDYFTYIRYGSKWDGMDLSTAYVTIDGVDELVNTRVQGSTFIVESTNKLITLKNGKRYICIQYTGDEP